MILLGKAGVERRESPLLRSLHGRYAATLGRVVHRPMAAYLALAATLVAGVAVLPFVGTSLVPPFRESQLLVSWNGAPGTSGPEMVRITTLASQELRSLSGVTNVGAHIGRAILSDEIVDVDSGELWVTLDPDADYEAAVDAVREVVGGFPGISADVQTYLDGRTDQSVTEDPDGDVVVRVFGTEMDVLAAKAAEIKQLLGGIDGVVNADVREPVRQPSIQVKVDLARAETHGIKPGDVRRAAGTYLNGLEVGSLYAQQKVFEVVVRGVPQVRSGLTSVEDLLVDTPGVAMSDSVTWRVCRSDRSRRSSNG